jgi:hypothetical protein
MLLIESCFGFGDCLFNIPLIEKIAETREVSVATMIGYKDAFENINCIEELILKYSLDRKSSLGFGRVEAERRGWDYLQVTQCVRFPQIKSQNPNHSLVHTAKYIGETMGLEIDPKPIFRPTQEELDATQFLSKEPRPIIAIESDYRSGQSWLKFNHLQKIVELYGDTYKILWLSNDLPSRHPSVDHMKGFTIRECIASLRFCETLFTTCSGFYVGNASMPYDMQADNVLCGFSWNQEKIYTIQNVISEHKWDKNLIWSHRFEDFYHRAKLLKKN